MNSKEWFRQAKFGFMSHFGLYTVLDGDYRGQPCSEWARKTMRIPMGEYHALANAFNPIYFDADEWVRLAKDAGMRYMVVTAKHHEGFAMYHSKVSSFNVVDATPFGRDVIGELSAACRRAGLRFGVYYSQDLDWDDPNGGGFLPSEWEPDCAHNIWDWPREREVDFERYLEEKVKPQVTELLTGYGDLCLIWFDCPWTMTEKQSRDLYDLVKKYQPECLVSTRLGNNIGDYGSGGDNDLEMKNGEWPLNEVPATISGTGYWNFAYYEQNYKSAQTLLAERDALNARGINYLLNIGPDHLGRIPGPALKVLRELAERNG